MDLMILHHIRCVSCGKVIKYNLVNEIKRYFNRPEETRGSIIDIYLKYNIRKDCCRRTLLTPIVISGSQEPRTFIPTPPLPPPESTTESHFNDYTANFGGEITFSKDGELMKKYITYNNFVGDLLEGFNYWIERILPRQFSDPHWDIIDQRDPTKPPVTYFIRNVYVNNPHIIQGNTIKPFYPQQARILNRSYMGDIIGDIYSRVGVEGKETLRSKGILLGSIPIMLGSVKCNLYGLTPEQLSAVGECPTDPFGYFIINGNEKVLLIQDKVRMDMPLVYNTKLGLSARFTASTLTSTKLVIVNLSKSKYLQLKVEYMGANYMPLFLAYTPFITGLDDAVNMILNFVRPPNRNKVRAFLLESYDLALKDTLGYTVNQLGAWLYSINKRVDYRNMPPLPDQDRDEQISYFIRDLFPQMNEDLEIYNEYGELIYNNDVIMRKYHLLSLMVARYVETVLGLRPLDDRNDYSNKRLENAGRMMYHLLNSCLKSIIGEARKTILGNVQDVTSAYKFEKITNVFHTSFNTSRWGVTDQHSANADTGMTNVAEIITAYNISTKYAYLTSINIPARRKAKQSGVRMISLTQLGFVDVTYSPEGANCGLVRAKSVTCQITIPIPEEGVLNAVKPYIKSMAEIIEPRALEGLSPCILNGKFLGWGPGDSIKRAVIDYRRNYEPGRGISVALTKDNIVFIYTDGGRPIRPLLVVEDGNLLIEEKNLWNEPFEVLLREGVVDYIDPLEQSTVLIAYTLDVFNAAKERFMRDPEIFDNPVDNNPLMENIQGRKEVIYSPKKYNYVELSPKAVLGVSSSLTPFANYNQGARNILTCNMSRQALSFYHSNFASRFDTTSKLLLTPSRPLVETEALTMLGMDKAPYGETVIVAFMNYTGHTQEDAFIFSRGSIDRGLFTMKTSHSYELELIQSNSTFQETLYVPDSKDHIYRHLYRSGEDPNTAVYPIPNIHGVARLGSYVQMNDVLAAVMRTYSNGEKKPYNLVSKFSEDGRVENITKQILPNGITLVRVKVSYVHSPIRGDKFACFPPGHEILTTKGWRNIEDLTLADEVATLEEGRLKYLTPEKVMEYPYNDLLYEVTTSHGATFLVTPNHRLYVRPSALSGQFILMEASSVPLGEGWMMAHNPKGCQGSSMASLDYSNIKSTAYKDLIMQQVLDCTTKYPVACFNPMQGSWEITLQEGAFHTSIRPGTWYSGKVYCCTVPSGIICVRNKVPGNKTAMGDRQKHIQVPLWIGNSRDAQKGTIGKILSEEDMPFSIENGMRPDIIVNSVAIPARMTIGKVFEIITSKLALIKGERINGSIFQNFNPQRIEDIYQMLESMGYTPENLNEFKGEFTGLKKYGYTEFIDGISGKIINGHVFTGPCYYMALRHHVLDNWQVRSIGGVKLNTHQPSGGKERQGGIRFGEQERDAIVSHGAANVLLDRLCASSNPFIAVVCKNCGRFARSSIIQSKISCPMCQGGNLVRVNVSYVYKYFIDLMNTLSFDLTMRTEPIQELRTIETSLNNISKEKMT